MAERSPKKRSKADIERKLEDLSRCMTVLSEIESGKRQPTDETADLVIELTHAILAIDKHDPDSLLGVLKPEIMTIFHSIVSSSYPASLKRSIYQGLTIVLQNLQTETLFIYLLSKDRLNNIIRYTVDETDADLVSYYVSLLRTLSFRVSEHNLPLFLQNGQSFPLFTNIFRYIDYPDNLIKTAVHTTILNILKLKSPLVFSFVQENGKNYLNALSLHLYRLCFDIDLLSSMPQPSVPSTKSKRLPKLQNEKAANQCCSTSFSLQCKAVQQRTKLIEKHTEWCHTGQKTALYPSLTTEKTNHETSDLSSTLLNSGDFISEFVESLLFLCDLYDIQDLTLSFVLTESVLSSFLIPLVRRFWQYSDHIGPLTSHSHQKSEDPTLRTSTCLLAFSHILHLPLPPIVIHSLCALLSFSPHSMSSHITHSPFQSLAGLPEAVHLLLPPLNKHSEPHYSTLFLSRSNPPTHPEFPSLFTLFSTLRNTSHTPTDSPFQTFQKSPHSPPPSVSGRFPLPFSLSLSAPNVSSFSQSIIHPPPLFRQRGIDAHRVVSCFFSNHHTHLEHTHRPGSLSPKRNELSDTFTTPSSLMTIPLSTLTARHTSSPITPILNLMLDQNADTLQELCAIIASSPSLLRSLFPRSTEDVSLPSTLLLACPTTLVHPILLTSLFDSILSSPSHLGNTSEIETLAKSLSSLSSISTAFPPNMHQLVSLWKENLNSLNNSEDLLSQLFCSFVYRSAPPLPAPDTNSLDGTSFTPTPVSMTTSPIKPKHNAVSEEENDEETAEDDSVFLSVILFLQSLISNTHVPTIFLDEIGLGQLDGTFSTMVRTRFPKGGKQETLESLQKCLHQTVEETLNSSTGSQSKELNFTDVDPAAPFDSPKSQTVSLPLNEGTQEITEAIVVDCSTGEVVNSDSLPSEFVLSAEPPATSEVEVSIESEQGVTYDCRIVDAILKRLAQTCHVEKREDEDEGGSFVGSIDVGTVRTQRMSAKTDSTASLTIRTITIEAALELLKLILSNSTKNTTADTPPRLAWWHQVKLEQCLLSFIAFFKTITSFDSPNPNDSAFSPYLSEILRLAINNNPGTGNDWEKLLIKPDLLQPADRFALPLPNSQFLHSQQQRNQNGQKQNHLNELSKSKDLFPDSLPSFPHGLDMSTLTRQNGDCSEHDASGVPNGPMYERSTEPIDMSKPNSPSQLASFHNPFREPLNVPIHSFGEGESNMISQTISTALKDPVITPELPNTPHPSASPNPTSSPLNFRSNTPSLTTPFPEPLSSPPPSLHPPSVTDSRGGVVMESLCPPPQNPGGMSIITDYSLRPSTSLLLGYCEFLHIDIDLSFEELLEKFRQDEEESPFLCFSQQLTRIFGHPFSNYLPFPKSNNYVPPDLKVSTSTESVPKFTRPPSTKRLFTAVHPISLSSAGSTRQLPVVQQHSPSLLPSLPPIRHSPHLTKRERKDTKPKKFKNFSDTLIAQCEFRHPQTPIDLLISTVHSVKVISDFVATTAGLPAVRFETSVPAERKTKGDGKDGEEETTLVVKSRECMPCVWYGRERDDCGYFHVSNDKVFFLVHSNDSLPDNPALLADPSQHSRLDDDARAFKVVCSFPLSTVHLFSSPISSNAFVLSDSGASMYLTFEAVLAFNPSWLDDRERTRQELYHSIQHKAIEAITRHHPPHPIVLDQPDILKVSESAVSTLDPSGTPPTTRQFPVLRNEEIETFSMSEQNDDEWMNSVDPSLRRFAILKRRDSASSASTHSLSAKNSPSSSPLKQTDTTPGMSPLGMTPKRQSVPLTTLPTPPQRVEVTTSTLHSKIDTSQLDSPALHIESLLLPFAENQQGSAEDVFITPTDLVHLHSFKCECSTCVRNRDHPISSDFSRTSVTSKGIKVSAFSRQSDQYIAEHSPSLVEIVINKQTTPLLRSRSFDMPRRDRSDESPPRFSYPRFIISHPPGTLPSTTLLFPTQSHLIAASRRIRAQQIQLERNEKENIERMLAPVNSRD